LSIAKVAHALQLLPNAKRCGKNRGRMKKCFIRRGSAQPMASALLRGEKRGKDAFFLRAVRPAALRRSKK